MCPDLAGGTIFLRDVYSAVDASAKDMGMGQIFLAPLGTTSFFASRSRRTMTLFTKSKQVGVDIGQFSATKEHQLDPSLVFAFFPNSPGDRR